MVAAQFGNMISGYVFGSSRQPVSDVTVELMDEFSRTLGRVQTNATGRFVFSRISSGRFRIRVTSIGDYEEQEQDVEIQNISTSDSSGNVRISGYDNVQKDFYLKPRKGAENLAKPESIFVQDIPAQAKETFLAALKALDNKDTDNGLKGLKLAIEQFPDYYNALELLGTEYVKLKHFVPAQVLLARAIQINPRGHKSWYGLAYSLYSLNFIKEAIDAAETGMQLNPRSVETTLLSGVVLRRAGRFGEAEDRFKKANTLANGAVAEVHWQLALLYNNDLKRYQDAVKELELYLKAAPDAKNKETVKDLIKELKVKADAGKEK